MNQPDKLSVNNTDNEYDEDIIFKITPQGEPWLEPLLVRDGYGKWSGSYYEEIKTQVIKELSNG